MSAERRFILKFAMAPGDVTMVTSLVRDLKLTYGDRYEIDIRIPYPTIWRHNPHLTSLDPLQPGVATIDFRRDAYLPSLRQSQRGHHIHFVRAFHCKFEELTGIHVPLHLPRADLHLTDEEKAKPLIEPPYWVVVPGGKDDMTNKIWSQQRWQQVVDRLREHGLQCVQEGAVKNHCLHPPLDGVLNLVGMTNIRDLMRNLYHAEGIICGVTLMMHLAGGLEKPCVCIAGGREEPWWEAYNNDYPGAFGDRCPPVQVPHCFLHTLGQLPCCGRSGCGRRRVVPLADNHRLFNRKTCLNPVTADEQILPRCLDLITVDQVVDAALSYYPDGQVPAANEPLRLLQPTELMRENNQRPERALQMRLPGEIYTAPAIAPLPAVTLPISSKESQSRWSVMDAPQIGGKMTICVLLQGHVLAEHRRRIQSILSTVPFNRMDLRIVSSRLGSNSIEYIRQLSVAAHTLFENISTYQLMRKLFHDPAHPILTPWLCWFDDKSYVRRADWLLELCRFLVSLRPEDQIGMVGQKMYHTLRQQGMYDPRSWMRAGIWHRGLPQRDKFGRPAPNGDTVHFCRGGFWCLRTETISACDLPDRRLENSGGDVVLGEQLYQNGYGLKQFNVGRQLVFTATQTHAKNGHQAPLPWCTVG